jgi:hypothetical protein
MFTCNLAAPAVRGGTAPSRTTYPGTSSVARDHWRRLFRALAGPASTAPFHHHQPTDRQDQSTRFDPQVDHRCARRRH